MPVASMAMEVSLCSAHGRMKNGEWRMENGGITYVNECDGNDSTRSRQEMHVRCRGENTWTYVNAGSEN
jgi:hypothetical protein